MMIMINDMFMYELCSQPSSIFDSCGVLREAHKSTLADAIWTLGDCSADTLPVGDVQYVLDGGYLLYRIPWCRGSTFSAICSSYINYVSKYKHPIVVFDGYPSHPTLKDSTHMRRTRGVSGPVVHFSGNTPLRSKKETFLTNASNKQNFINMLGRDMQEQSIRVHHAVDDADVLIVKTAISCATQHQTVVIGEDTDLLVMLCSQTQPESCDVYFASELKHRSSKKARIWDIHRTQTVLGQEACCLLPFAHAISGCDTTSRLFGIGKSAVLKKVLNDHEFKAQGMIFIENSTKDQVMQAGERALVSLYNGHPDEGLDVLRFRRYVNRVIESKSIVQVHSLPPTSAAASYHSLRVYLQVKLWLDEGDGLFPSEWGWYEGQNKLLPIKTHLSPAPDTLLRIIRCNCKTNCDTKRCTCRKHGLECSVGCGECRGISCSNSQSDAESMEDNESL